MSIAGNGNSNVVFIATDSEWDDSRPDKWISTVISDGARSVLYATDDVPDEVRCGGRESPPS